MHQSALHPEQGLMSTAMCGKTGILKASQLHPGHLLPFVWGAPTQRWVQRLVNVHRAHTDLHPASVVTR